MAPSRDRAQVGAKHVQASPDMYQHCTTTGFCIG
jgi:hypothetical protein